MKIKRTKYVNATKTFPLKFEDNDSEDTDLLEDAYFYNSEKEAQDDVDGRFDEPETRQIIPITVTYEL